MVTHWARMLGRAEADDVYHDRASSPATLEAERKLAEALEAARLVLSREDADDLEDRAEEIAGDACERRFDRLARLEDSAPTL